MSLPAPFTASYAYQLLRQATLGVSSVFAIYFAYLAFAALHELGHWSAGTACGFIAHEFRVGPLRWLRASGWGLQWEGNYLLSAWVRSQPTGIERAFRLRLLTFVLAGPLASIGGGLFVVEFARSETTAEGVARLFAFASILVGFLELLPFQKGKLQSDGLQAFEILSASGLRKWRFKARFMENCPAVGEALRIKDWNRAKQLAEEVLAFAQDIPESDETLKAVRSVHDSSSRRLSGKGSDAANIATSGKPQYPAALPK
jgi:hypothetical protein